MSAPGGLPVALLHGCGGSPTSTFVDAGWVDGLAAAGRMALPVTLPGHGPNASHDPSDYADLAGDTLAALPERFDGIGFSLGAKLLLEIACRAPERINRLVLGGIGDNVFAPEASGEANAAILERGIDDATPPAARGVYRYCQASGVDPLAIAAVLRRRHNPDITRERLRSVLANILLVIGDADMVALPADGLISALADAGTIFLPGVDHFGLPADSHFQRHALKFLAPSAVSEERGVQCKKGFAL